MSLFIFVAIEVLFYLILWSSRMHNKNRKIQRDYLSCLCWTFTVSHHVIHRCDFWINCFSHLAACVVFLAPWKLDKNKGAFRVDPAHIRILCSECVVSSAIETSASERQPRVMQLLALSTIWKELSYAWGCVFTSLWFCIEHCQPKWLNLCKLYMYTHMLRKVCLNTLKYIVYNFK